MTTKVVNAEGDCVKHPTVDAGSYDFDEEEEYPPLTVQFVDRALDEVRPYLIADGGNVEVVDVEDGIVKLRLQGACGTCASSTATMKMGIERSLMVSLCCSAVVSSWIVDRLQLGSSFFFLSSSPPGSLVKTCTTEGSVQLRCHTFVSLCPSPSCSSLAVVLCRLS